MHRRRKATPNSEDAAAEPRPPSLAPAVDDQPTEIDLVLAAELGDPAAEAQSVAPVVEEWRPPWKHRSPGSARGRTRTAPPPRPWWPPPPHRRGGSREHRPRPAPPAEPVYADIADIFEAAERAEAELLHARIQARQAAEEAAVAAPAASPVVESAAEPETAAPLPAAPVQAEPAPVAPTPGAPVAGRTGHGGSGIGRAPGQAGPHQRRSPRRGEKTRLVAALKPSPPPAGPTPAGVPIAYRITCLNHPTNAYPPKSGAIFDRHFMMPIKAFPLNKGYRLGIPGAAVVI